MREKRIPRPTRPSRETSFAADPVIRRGDVGRLQYAFMCRWLVNVRWLLGIDVVRM